MRVNGRSGASIVLGGVLIAGACALHSDDEGGAAQRSRREKATIGSCSGSLVTGSAVFVAAADRVTLELELRGLTPGVHAVHLHEKGDCSAPDGMSAGNHWNPTDQQHGEWGHDSFHLGDIGNVIAGQDGEAKFRLETDRWSIGSGEANDILNRSVIVHDKPDDFTTQPTGAAGGRVGCGVIEKG
jgi:Cu-Zn family superoxide dismutase